MSDHAQTISKEDWLKQLAKTADNGVTAGIFFGWLGVPLLAGLALAFIAGLPLWGLGVGFGAVVLGLLRGAIADENSSDFYKWEENKIENISYKNNKGQAFLTGFLLFAPIASPLLWPISFVVKNSMKAAEGSDSLKQAFVQTITAPIKLVFGNPVLAQEKQAPAAEKAAEKAAAKAAQKAKAEPAQLAAPIAVAAPVIEPAIRPARSTIGDKRVTVRLPGAAPGEGA